MTPLSDDLRRRIIAARANGEGTGEVSQRFKVSRKSVERFWKQHSMTGECRPKQIGGYRRSRLQKHAATLKRWISQQAGPHGRLDAMTAGVSTGSSSAGARKLAAKALAARGQKRARRFMR